MYLQLIKFMLIYNIYNKYYNIIYNILKDNKELNILMLYLNKLHNKYKKDLTLEEFSLYVLTNCPEKDRDNLETILSGVKDTSTTSVVLEDLIREIQQKQRAYTLAVQALEVSEGRKDFSDLLLSVKDLNSTEVDSVLSEGTFVTDDLEELYNDKLKSTGLRWRLHTLNRMLGSLRKGDFGFIFARPETGKTTFLASEVSNFASQVNSPILWLNNEEDGGKVKLRLYQAMLGVDLPTLYSDIPKHKERYLELGGSNIKLYDNAAIHRKQVELLCQELNPSLIVFDQIDKIKGFQDDREDLRLGAIYIWAREIAKTYCPVIGVCQADVSGEGKRWLTMDNVANAKTAKQAEADWILGIGKTHSPAEEYQRHLHLSKNKLAGDLDSDPNLRHGRESVKILADIARYEDY